MAGMLPVGPYKEFLRRTGHLLRPGTHLSSLALQPAHTLLPPLIPHHYSTKTTFTQYLEDVYLLDASLKKRIL
ncbi:hypothetical protein, partial [Salmonella sp. s51090]|uniref:hypothetical protein n=1 Tax=Salmonella sp. s51090 TaxID=3159651 RepID=UPI00398035FA